MQALNARKENISVLKNRIGHLVSPIAIRYLEAYAWRQSQNAQIYQQILLEALCVLRSRSTQWSKHDDGSTRPGHHQTQNVGSDGVEPTTHKGQLQAKCMLDIVERVVNPRLRKKETPKKQFRPVILSGEKCPLCKDALYKESKQTRKADEGASIVISCMNPDCDYENFIK